MEDNHRSNDRMDGVTEFLRIVLEDPKEDKLYVSYRKSDERVRITGEPGICAIRPRWRELSIVEKDRIKLKWSERFEFVRWEPPQYDEEYDLITNQASPHYLLALDLVGWKPNIFEIESDLRFSENSLGLVWTENTTRDLVIPWPMMKKRPQSPVEWIREIKRWNKISRKYAQDSGNHSEESLLKAWCAFIAKQKPARANSLEAHLSYLDPKKNPEFAVFSNENFGFSSHLLENVQEFQSKNGDWMQEEGDRYLESFARKSSQRLDRIDPNALAFVLEFGDPVGFAPPNANSTAT